MSSGSRRVLATLLVLGAAGFAPRSGPRIAADTLTALPAANVQKPLRVAAGVRWNPATTPPAWSRFQTRAGGAWQAAWDQATGVPKRIWGSGIAAPGANANAAIAERVARAVLAEHVGLLAPGAAVTDFELVSNHSDGAIRSIGFVQRAGGRRVVGGQISFEFKRDRLFVIGSEALPNVSVTATAARMPAAALASRVTASLRTAVDLPSAPVRASGADVILPLVADDAVLGYRLVTPFEIDGKGDGRYAGYADPATGAIVAVHQLNEYATGRVIYRGVDRWFGRGYVDRIAPRMHATVNGAAQTTGADGSVTWSAGTAAVTATADGDLVAVTNASQTGMVNATSMLAVAPDASGTWDASAAGEIDAQVQAYLDTNLAKEYVRTHIDSGMPTLDDTIPVNVNLNMTCNAFFDGTGLNFFRSGDPNGGDTCMPGQLCCANTAQIQDVNFHEYGHRVHTAEIIPGVGAFDGAMSEGAADFLSATMTNDSGMGRGFTFSDDPLRELDPPGMEWRWPNDINSDIHHTGMIFGGTFWDLRKAFIAQYGQTAGEALTNQLYAAALRRAVDIPSVLVEVLAADDDDGNLANGTPHECTIRGVFGAHGLRTATGTIIAPGTLDEITGSLGIAIQMLGLSSCGTDQPSVADLYWYPAYNGKPAAGNVIAYPNGPGRFTAQLPLSPEGAVQYRANLEFADGTTMVLPDNIADPQYQLWNGPTVKLYCTDFEHGDPFAEGWTQGAKETIANTMLDPTWAVVTPSRLGGTNPPAAYSGTHALEQAPNTDYTLKQYTWVKTPEIDVGKYTDVHLQYRRWLAVQDANFDQARITANGNKAWINFTDPHLGDASAKHHVDKEWRFQDVALSGYFAGTKLQVGWDLKSDGGLEYAGWAIDDVCIVANPAQICGDGVRGPYEQCDKGGDNADVADTCRTSCRLPTCGDMIVDSNEDCDDGPAGSPKCGADCTMTHPVTGTGCCEAGGGGGVGAGALALFVGAMLTRSSRTRGRRSRAR